MVGIFDIRNPRNLILLKNELDLVLTLLADNYAVVNTFFILAYIVDVFVVLFTDHTEPF